MGFNTTANTITLTAKLTPIGRQRLVSTNNALISSFSLGDSDANYNVPLTLTTGQIPAEAGEIGSNASVSNSTTLNANIKSRLIVNNGSLTKPVENQSTLNAKEYDMAPMFGDTKDSKLYLLPLDKAHDIDTYDDWKFVKKLYKIQKHI